MSFASRLKIESIGAFLTVLFYAAAGLIFLGLLFTTGFPPHIGIIGVFSLITAYGMLRKRSWTVWLATVLLFVGTTFSGYTLYYYAAVAANYLLSMTMIAYLILTWVFAIYVAAKRKSLET